ncbi:FecR family protein [Legionella tucsonensis]|uniref:FecR protein n=1 Tax=Legionella tucsonensis TaxID=40335 RepID=A0A0W0ZZM5_9GAMM|nr:FecR family protein [Legionella tucsonensis]KTD74541.1 FecR protein [Legionella tucsonensis]
MKKVIFTGLLMLATQLFAQSAATVLFTQKEVVVRHNGAERGITRGSSVEVGDEVVTGDDAAANLQYANGALVSMGADSNYKILAYAPKESVQIKAELSKGKLEIKTPENIKESLKTPILSLAILGTHIRVYVVGKETYIQVMDGLVLARGEYLRPGTSVRVTADRMENAPFPKEGEVKIAAATAVSAIETETGRTANTGSGSGADSVSFVSTVEITSTSTSTTTDAAQVASMADISLICQTPPTI